MERVTEGMTQEDNRYWHPQSDRGLATHMRKNAQQRCRYTRSVLNCRVVPKEAQRATTLVKKLLSVAKDKIVSNVAMSKSVGETGASLLLLSSACDMHNKKNKFTTHKQCDNVTSPL
eukprot:220690-Amphidinium_carterae.1